MSRSLLWINNLKDEDTDIQVFDTSETGAIEEYNLTWNFRADYSEWMNADGSQFLAGEWNFYYMDISSPGDVVFVTVEVAGDSTPEELQVILNTDAESQPMGTWTVVQLTNWTGESSDDTETVEENRTFNFNVVCDMDADWLRANVDIFYPADFTPRQVNGAVELKIDGGGGFTNAITAADNPENFYRPAVKNPTTKEFENLVEVKSYDLFDYNSLKLSAATDSYLVREFVVYSNNPNQLLQPFLFERLTATGKHYQKVIAPTISPYQQQRYVKSPYLEGYKMDGFTTIKYKILANTDARIVMHKQSSQYIIEDNLISQPNFKTTPKSGNAIRNRYVNQAGSGVSQAFKDNVDTLGCGALNQVLYNNQQKLQELQTAGTNPNWQQMLMDKIDYVESLIATNLCSVNPQAPGSQTTSPGQVSQTFKDNTKNLKCKGWAKVIVKLEDKLNTLQSKPAGQRNPIWQQSIKDKIEHLEDKIKDNKCVLDIDEEFSEEQFGDPTEYGKSALGTKLWMPTEAFMKETKETEDRQDGFYTEIDKISFPFEKT